MTSSARRDLEKAVRAIVPAQPPTLRDDPVNVALAGAGGTLLGFVWGFWRGRRRRRAAAKR